MVEFDKIAADLGWIKPYADIDLWYKIGDEWYTAVFEMSDIVSSTRRFGELITEDTVRRTMVALPTTKFKEKDIDWVLPLLTCDYFFWRRDFEQELKWAKIAMSKNSKLEKEAFSKHIQDKL